MPEVGVILPKTGAIKLDKLVVVNIAEVPLGSV
jgi:hypothetical protein